jgi:PAS domain S-box-containing protein
MLEKECFDTLCNSGDGVFIVDADRHIVRWNAAAEKILKYPEGDVVNRECFRVVSGRSSPDTKFCSQSCSIHSCVLKGGRPENFDLFTQTREGDPIWLNVTILSQSNTPNPFIAHIVRDITSEKGASLALERFLGDLSTSKGEHRENSSNGMVGEPAAASRQRSRYKASTGLSGREIEVLTLLAEGLSTRSLALKLNISHFTARNHIQNILVKLGLHSKAQAVSYAFKKGLL